VISPVQPLRLHIISAANLNPVTDFQCSQHGEPETCRSRADEARGESSVCMANID
jgi:hypothetical protein